MLRPEDLDFNWGLLTDKDFAHDELRVREADEIQIAGMPVLFAVDEQQHRQLLIPIETGKALREDKRSSGVQITLRTMLDGTRLRTFLTMVCLKPHLDPLFSIITSEVIERLQTDFTAPDLTAQQVLNRWRELLERPPSNMPAHEVLIGAFGELYTLRQLVRHDREALRFWLGADNARHDFLAHSAALEVKTTTDRNRLAVTVRGHDQLEPPVNAVLYLVLIHIERVGNGGDSLKDLVEQIVDLGCDLSALLAQLGKIDITPDVLTQLRDERYIVRDRHVYLVDDAFPKLTSTSFASGKVPERISMITYQIDLAARPPYPLSDERVEVLYKNIASEASL